MKMLDLHSPYLCTNFLFKKYNVSGAAINFLKIEHIPVNARNSWNLIFNFFHSNSPLKAQRFQELANFCCYNKFSKNENTNREIVANILEESSISDKDYKYVRYLFSLTFYYLAVNGKVHIPPAPLLVPTRSALLFRSEIIQKFSIEVRFWLIAGTKDRIKEFYDILDNSLSNAALKWISENPNRYKSYNGSVNSIRHYFALAKIDKMTISNLAKTQKIWSAISSRGNSILPILQIYASARREDFKPEYDYQFSTLEFKISDIRSIYRPTIIESRKDSGLEYPDDFNRSAKTRGVTINKNRKYSSNIREYKGELPRNIKSDYGLLVYTETIKKPKGYSAYQVSKIRELRIGDYFISISNLRFYNPKHLAKTKSNMWISHQLDWLESGYEKSTIKIKSRILKYLNTYLFSYLPWFKENIDNSITVPDGIESFNPNIFVKRTHAFSLNLDPEKILPITFPEFLVKALDIGVESGKANLNVVASAQRNILSFFEYYRELSGTKVGNPMQVAPRIRGFSYATSTKIRIDYEYWLFFREFILSFSKIALHAFQDSILEGVHVPKLWKDCFHSYAATEVVEFAGLRIEMSKLASIEDYDPKSTTSLAALICLVSQCGIRFSNALWLDSRTFDSLAPANCEDEKLVQVSINTDKVQLRPYQSHVSFRVIKLLRSLDKCRKQLSFDELIYYQNNPSSKWGEIIPLFRYSLERHDEGTAHTLASRCLTNLVVSFESLLRLEKIEFDSYIYPSTFGLSYDDYLYLKSSRTQSSIRTFIVENNCYNEEKDQAPRPVSFFSYKSSMTLHSFRKTFDSFYSLFLTNEDIGKLFTGQTPKTVGYYASNTVEDYESARTLEKNMPAPFPIRKHKKNSQNIIDYIKENGIRNDSTNITTGAFGDFNLSDEYKCAPENDIAVNRTHICPYNNQCPSTIRKFLDNRKLCGICPAALSFASDAPAIAAKIKQLGDEIADLSLAIISGELLKGETEDYQQKRIILISEFSAWMARHDHLLKISAGEVLIGEDGHDHYRSKLTYQKPAESWSEEKINLWRIFETAEVRTMQSDRIRRTATRYIRKLIKHIDSDTMNKIEIDPVRIAALLIEKTATLNGLNLEQVVNSIIDGRRVKNVPLTALLIGTLNDA